MVEALKQLVGARSLSATIEGALADRLSAIRHQRAVDEWMAELEAEHGPVPEDAARWAEDTDAGWDAKRNAGRRTSAPA